MYQYEPFSRFPFSALEMLLSLWYSFLAIFSALSLECFSNWSSLGSGSHRNVVITRQYSTPGPRPNSREGEKCNSIYLTQHMYLGTHVQSHPLKIVLTLLTDRANNPNPPRGTAYLRCQGPPSSSSAWCLPPYCIPTAASTPTQQL